MHWDSFPLLTAPKLISPCHSNSSNLGNHLWSDSSPETWQRNAVTLWPVVTSKESVCRCRGEEAEEELLLT